MSRFQESPALNPGNSGNLIAATLAAVALILSAPFLGEIRRTLQTTFPAQYLTILGVMLGLIVASALVVALVRIRERRALRYGAIGAALVFGTLYSVWTATPNPQVNAVERFHFVEYGVVTLLFYRVWRPLEDGSVFVLPVLAGLLVATLEEWFQWFIPARVGEMRDVFLNGAAIGTGLLFSVGVDPPRTLSLALGPGSLRRIGITAAIVIAAFAAFLHSVHLGYVVSDPVAGSFTSRYTAGTLRALAGERTARWKTDPPLVLRRLSREDQYMSEGLLHVRERNQRWSAGDVTAAWHENLILERFYAPVLDTASYVSRTGHRWSPEQRADAEARLAAAPRSAAAYVSRADDGFIRTWPKPVFWALVALVVGTIGWSSSRT